MDQEMEQRVWERVSGQEQNCACLRGMEQCCQESAAVFHALAASAAGERREQLQKLSRAEYNNAMTIRGMRILDGEEPEPMQFPAQKQSSRRALAQSFRRSQQAGKDYAAHSRDAEYGPIFSQMADEEKKIQSAILSLLAGAGK